MHTYTWEEKQFLFFSVCVFSLTYLVVLFPGSPAVWSPFLIHLRNGELLNRPIQLVFFLDLFCQSWLLSKPLFLWVSLNSRMFWPFIWIVFCTEVSQRIVAHLVLLARVKGNKCTEVLHFQYVFNIICVFYAPALCNYTVLSSQNLPLIFLSSWPN